MAYRSVSFDEIYNTLSHVDSRWRFFDNQVVILTSGQKFRIRIRYTSPHVVGFFDYGGTQSRDLSLLEMSKTLRSVFLSVGNRLEDPQWEWFRTFASTDEEHAREATTVEERAAQQKKVDAAAKAARSAALAEKQALQRAEIDAIYAEISASKVEFEAKRQLAVDLGEKEKERQRQTMLLEIQDWFGSPLPKGDMLGTQLLFLLSEASQKDILPSELGNQEIREFEEYLADAIWWLRLARIEQSLYHLATSSSRWRSGRQPDVAVSITSPEIERHQDHRPYIERVLTSHAAALCDIYAVKREDDSLLTRAKGADQRAANKNPHDPHPHMQLHRVYGLMGLPELAVSEMHVAYVLAERRESNAQFHKTKQDIEREIRRSWRENTESTWRDRYAGAYREMIKAGNLPDSLEVPF